jgi:hypothetical protein
LDQDGGGRLYEIVRRGAGYFCKRRVQSSAIGFEGRAQPIVGDPKSVAEEGFACRIFACRISENDASALIEERAPFFGAHQRPRVLAVMNSSIRKADGIF